MNACLWSYKTQILSLDYHLQILFLIYPPDTKYALHQPPTCHMTGERSKLSFCRKSCWPIPSRTCDHDQGERGPGSVKGFPGTRPHSFPPPLPTAILVVQRQSWVPLTDTCGPQSPKYWASGPLCQIPRFYSTKDKVCLHTDNWGRCYCCF